MCRGLQKSWVEQHHPRMLPATSYQRQGQVPAHGGPALGNSLRWIQCCPVLRAAGSWQQGGYQGRLWPHTPIPHAFLWLFLRWLGLRLYYILVEKIEVLHYYKLLLTPLKKWQLG